LQQQFHYFLFCSFLCALSLSLSLSLFPAHSVAGIEEEEEEEEKGKLEKYLWLNRQQKPIPLVGATGIILVSSKGLFFAERLRLPLTSPQFSKK
jgi:hypothetical protein